MTIQFESDVFPRELDEVDARRRKLCLPRIEDPSERISAADESAGGWFRPSSVLREPEKQETLSRVRPTTRHGLVGLALSGGGIRSASFCLGVLQLLAKHGIPSRVDFLSTVSGGGYIGSCLSAATTEPQTAGTLPEGFPFRHEDGVPEAKAFKHLRHHASYLAARGIQTDLEAVRDQLEGPEADEGAVYLATTAAIFYVWAHAANEEKCGLNDEASCDRTALGDQTYLKEARAVLRPRLSDSEVKLAGRAGGSIASAPGRIRYVLWYREIDGRITSEQAGAR